MIRLLFFAVLALLISTVYADDFERKEIQKRIAPYGKVRLEKAESEQSESKAVKQSDETVTASTEVTGESVYKQYCSVCHKGGLAGAPKFQDEADWKPRLAKMDVAALTASAIKGKNAMPAKGTCMDCSDKDIQAAIEYMLPSKKP